MNLILHDKRFEENLARVTSEVCTTKNLVARIKVFLPQPHWSFQTVDDQKTREVLFTGPATPYLSRSTDNPAAVRTVLNHSAPGILGEDGYRFGPFISKDF